MVKRVLVVEDESAIREMICFVLAQQGYDLLQAEDYQQGVRQLALPCPDLAIIDWMLPEGTGIELIEYMKRDPLLWDIPIIMLSARGETEDRVTGLDVGADDYITKPFSPKELVARIKALMRRTPTSKSTQSSEVTPINQSSKKHEIVEYNGLTIDTLSHRVMVGDSLIDLGPTEFKLLLFFMHHPERVYSRDHLLDQVWGTNVYVEDRTVDVVIRRLRKILETTGHDKMIQTVRGSGYRFSVKY